MVLSDVERVIQALFFMFLFMLIAMTYMYSMLMSRDVKPPMYDELV